MAIYAKFNERAQRVLSAAQKEAQGMRHSYVGTEHILLALLKNEDSVVTSLAKRQDVQRYESRAMMERLFDHSLPQFVAAFLGEKKLSAKEAEELRKMIDSLQEKGGGEA